MGHSVSVVIATNRGGPFLPAAVASVQGQTAPVAEITLVDDGVPDDSVRRFADEQGLAYLRNPSSGVSSARNAGARSTTSDWLAFLDDDDVWHPTRIEAQLDALATRPEAIASYTGGWYMDIAGAEFGSGWRAPTTPNMRMLDGTVPLPRITTLLVRRDAFSRVGGFNPTMKVGEDNDLIRKLLIRGDFVAVDVPLVGYRRHAGNVSNHLLEGRASALHSIRRLRSVAAAEGDTATTAALTEWWRRFRQAGSDENLGDLVAAVRRREWDYAARVAWWGACVFPWQSVLAVARRLRRQD
ncbi:glycosyltransferase family 2 protein [Microbacterium terrisoli]|jgi:glycosyltransferase involved in cell wall biosynthesis|uniref:glycosyltransferase family 2 protein n=1 Tax=Microbacterium terrisoli TaxID=3242192 RepID=UPI002806056E|nr:glycosyltransferase family A protein [Microbacterium protaetiae]